MYMGRYSQISQILALSTLLTITGSKMFLHCIHYCN